MKRVKMDRFYQMKCGEGKGTGMCRVEKADLTFLDTAQQLKL